MEQERNHDKLGVSSFMTKLKAKRSTDNGTSNPKKAYRKAKGQAAS